MQYWPTVCDAGPTLLQPWVDVSKLLCDLAVTIASDKAGPDGSLVLPGVVTWRYQARIPVGPDICHRGCAYTVLQTVQRPGAYSAAYGTVHYKEPLMSFEIRLGHSPGFGLSSVAILP